MASQAIEVIDRVVLDEIVKEGVDTPAKLEQAVYDVMEWLTKLDLRPGDELVVVRRKET